VEEKQERKFEVEIGHSNKLVLTSSEKVGKGRDSAVSAKKQQYFIAKLIEGR